MVTVGTGSMTSVKALLEANVDISIKDNAGRTVANYDKHKQFVQLLKFT